MGRVWLLASGVLGLTCLCAAPPSASAAEKSDWFHQARWGVMTHYLGAPPSSAGGAELTADMWNRQVDAFDVAGLAARLGRNGRKRVEDVWNGAAFARRVAAILERPA